MLAKSQTLLENLYRTKFKNAGKLALLAGVLAGNILNWIRLSLMIIGGVSCYFSARPDEK